jgi:cysteine-rich repeat protein
MERRAQAEEDQEHWFPGVCEFYMLNPSMNSNSNATMQPNGNATGRRRGGGTLLHAVAMVFVIALIAVTGACLQVGTPCGEGFCPIGHACVQTEEGSPRCVASSKVNTCGNGVVEVVRKEVCDDGNETDGDGCSADCRSDERCGNGIIDTARGETCDCGDGEIRNTEAQCGGRQNSASGGYCRDDCKIHCGDGKVADEEVCDRNLPITASCVDLRYDFGRSGCTNACDGLSTVPCGDWNWRAQVSATSAGLIGVWGSGPEDVFAVGDAGTIVHYDGQDWKPMASRTRGRLIGVWGSGPEDVFAVGSFGAFLHYDGVSWLKLNSTTASVLNAIWGDGKSSFVVGDQGAIYHHTRTAPPR